jgi:hypothetical protein
MFAKARYSVVFNFLTTYNDYEVDAQFYLDPREVSSDKATECLSSQLFIGTSES